MCDSRAAEATRADSWRLGTPDPGARATLRLVSR